MKLIPYTTLVRSPDAFAVRVSGRTILGLGRRAKYLLVDLDDGNTLISHLGMSGSFRIEDLGAALIGASLAPHAFAE
ncbi:DNA-formamidopyrimidine glycosylase family protein, partial [Rhizobium brockwellii]|uniref:DNA-formamidopyrimidine glycosylase family protein n=1 Tax=Rhizobium brockwellii TaxID=3019932 RepID=UPI003F9DE459